jgi:hypothetical protein
MWLTAMALKSRISAAAFPKPFLHYLAVADDLLKKSHFPFLLQSIAPLMVSVN